MSHRGGKAVGEGKSAGVGLYLDYFKEGLHIPVSIFLVEVVRYYKIHMSQLTSNAVSYIIRFEVFCRSQGRACTVGLFRYFSSEIVPVLV